MRDDNNSLTVLAEERLHHYHFHSNRMWIWHGWLLGWTLVANILVPFGLAALLYIPSDWHRAITLTLLVVSGLALALQVLAPIQRFKERALRLRSMHAELQTVLADYRSGLATDGDLSEALKASGRKHAEEEAP